MTEPTDVVSSPPREEDIVVTGLGATTPLGGDVATFWAGLLEGRSGVGRPDRGLGRRPQGAHRRTDGVDPAETLSRVQARRLDRAQQAALVAAQEAWADAGFTGTSADNGLEPERVAVVIGTGIGGVTSLIHQHDVMLEKGPGRVSPLLIPMDMPNGPAAHVGLMIGARSGVFTPVSACASGAEAIAYGLDLMALDRADVVVVGGTEACIHGLTMSGFAQMQAMSTRNDEPQRASRPFDKARNGFVLGEGAGVLVLERRSSAEARGATAICRARRSGDDGRLLRHRRARPGRQRPAPGGQAGHVAGRGRAGRGRARQRARDLDPGR